uniref:Sarcoplasmic calcium-binding protein n=1 Tax=Branchiostoma belcheri TaxID=7741 RepID=Q8MY10_BRABE|nr:sarcoplasmic calcium-binding protein [Branchiostoma belcheri]
MGLNDFQKQKIKFTFDFFLDMNHDGSIQWNDFEDMMTRYKEVNKGSLSDADYKSMQASLEDEWRDLKGRADINKDDVVSWEEYLAMWEKTIATCKSVADLPAWCQSRIPFLFKGMDVSGDGIVDLEEFQNYCKNFQLQCADVPAVTTLSQTEGKVTSTSTATRKLYYRLLTSPSADAGNTLMGQKP